MTIKIESQQLGPLEIPEEGVINFHHGLPGFPSKKKYCLVSVKEGGRFQLLQSIDKAELAFVVMDPLQVDPEYPIEFVGQLGVRAGMVDEGETVAIATIVNVTAPPDVKMTANLAAPLVIGAESRSGGQVLLQDGAYQIRHPL